MLWNNASVNSCIHVFISFVYISKSRIAGCIFTLFTFEELPGCFPERLLHFKIPPAVHKSSSYSTSWPTFVIICLFYYSILIGVKWAFLYF